MARPKRVLGEGPLCWIGPSTKELVAFPETVKDEIGTALSVAQFGGEHPHRNPGEGRYRASSK
jgi:phage-related protein